MNKKSNIILVVVIVIILGSVGYFAFVKKSGPTVQQPTTTSTTNSTKTSTSSSKDETASWKTYTNTEFSFSVRYQEDWEAPEFFGGVSVPGGATYSVGDATAYEFVFTFIPRRIDDFPAIITIYKLSGGNTDTATIREKIIAQQWDHCDKDKLSRCKKDVTRKTVTVSGNKALLVTITGTFENDVADKVIESISSRTYLFIEKADRVYEIHGRDENSLITNNDFELFYTSFELTK